MARDGDMEVGVPVGLLLHHRQHVGAGGVAECLDVVDAALLGCELQACVVASTGVTVAQET